MLLCLSVVLCCLAFFLSISWMIKVMYMYTYTCSNKNAHFYLHSTYSVPHVSHHCMSSSLILEFWQRVLGSQPCRYRVAKLNFYLTHTQYTGTSINTIIKNVALQHILLCNSPAYRLSSDYPDKRNDNNKE